MEDLAAGDLHALADLIAEQVPSTDPVDLLDRLEALERVKSAVAAAQVMVAAAFADAAEAEVETGDVPVTGRRTPPRAMSIGAEVALATLSSPHAGERRVLLSRRLRDHLPHTLAALARGELTEHRALTVAREVAHLHPDQRRRVDTDLAPRLAGLGDTRLRRAVRRSCLTHAADAETHRYTRARADRRVTTRRLDDGTGQLVATLRLEDLAAVRATLDAAAATARSAGDPRTGGQVRADTLVGRLTGTGTGTGTGTNTGTNTGTGMGTGTGTGMGTGTGTGTDTDSGPVSDVPAVRVNLVIGLESLTGHSTEPGLINGEDHLPAALCADLVRRASDAAKATIRRLFATPETRTLVAMESTTRRFDGLLAELIDLRDAGTCRTPGCDATIRHHDHVVPLRDGGPTTATNGQGLCERCNHLKETPGWTSWTPHPPPDTPPGGPHHGPHHGPHEVHGVTEHLRLIRSTAPPLPGGPPHADTLPSWSPAEARLVARLAEVA